MSYTVDDKPNQIELKDFDIKEMIKPLSMD